MSSSQLVLCDLIYIKKDTAKEVKCLSALKKDAKLLQRVAEEKKDKSAAKERELEEEIVCLTKEKDSYDLIISQLNEERRNVEHRVSQQRQTLSNAESDLCGARTIMFDVESELSRANEKMTIAVAAGVAVGILSFGIGGVAAGAAVAAIALLISEIKGRVEQTKSRIQSRENDIASAQSAIRNTNQALSNIQRMISDHNGRILNIKRRLMEVHDKITENKLTLAVHRQAWELFALASDNAPETHLLKIVQKANEEQNLRIIRSNGTVKIAKSVVEAWEEISFNRGRITSQ